MFDKEWWAKWVRILTTPQVSAIALVSLLAVQQPEMFRGMRDYSVSIFFLGIFPLLAYSIARIMPTVRVMGREGLLFAWLFDPLPLRTMLFRGQAAISSL